MNIGIAMGRKGKIKARETGSLSALEILYTWADIERHNKKGVFVIPRNFYDCVKLLELNETLDEEVSKFRNKFKINPALDYPEMLIREGKTIYEEGGFKKSGERLKYIQEIFPRFDMPSWLRNIRTFQILFYKSVIVLDSTPISSITSAPIYDAAYNGEPVAIYINYSGVERRTIAKYIEDNWGQISEGISKLPPPSKYALSREAKKIFTLKSEGKSNSGRNKKF